jgi:hypothetical protein
MPLRPIPDKDGLFRHVVFPNGFKSTKKRDKARFEYKKLIKWYDELDGIHASLAWERYLPTTKDVHGYGCRLASRRNESLKSNGKYTEEKRNIYCGTYRLTAQTIHNLIFSPDFREILSTQVTHKIEEGEIAHVDVRVVLNSGWSDIEGTKTAIMDRLWSKSTGPLKHVCEYDQDIDPHPNAQLETPPGGDYEDRRSWWVWSFFVVRFHMLCFWNHLSGIASEGN